MLDIFFAMIAAGINTADTTNGDQSVALASPQAPAVTAAPETPEAADPAGTALASPTVTIGENVTVGSAVIGGGALQRAAPVQPAPATGGLLDGTSESLASAAPAPSPFNMAVVPAGLTADPQEPTGKFTTATEVKPILNATKGNWVAVREYDGKDYLYVTHLWGWRCGLKAMAISVNGEAMQNWPLPPCHEKYTTPNAVLEEDGLPVLTLRLGAVETIDIQIVYDDLSMDAASFERANVLIP